MFRILIAEASTVQVSGFANHRTQIPRNCNHRIACFSFVLLLPPPVSNHPRRHASNNGAGRNGFCDHGTCGYDRAGGDVHTSQDDGIRADPHVVFDEYFPLLAAL